LMAMPSPPSPLFFARAISLPAARHGYSSCSGTIGHSVDGTAGWAAGAGDADGDAAGAGGGSPPLVSGGSSGGRRAPDAAAAGCVPPARSVTVAAASPDGAPDAA